jgi:Kdo2-lipid IVA lauroyltransferase/acyltransferase
MNGSVAPPLGWLLRPGRHRREAWQYWVVDPLAGAVYAGVYYAFRLASIDTCSWAGAAFGSFARRHIGFDLGEFRRSRRDEARARDNWVWLRPQDNEPAMVKAAMETAYRQGSRAYLEFSVLDRLWRSGRITVQGEAHLAWVKAAKRSVIVAGLHLGNWETIAPALIGLGHTVTAVYQVPRNRFDHRLAVAARLRYGVSLIPPAPPGTRARIAHRTLSAPGGVLLIYIDECVNGRVYAPFFGRPQKSEGNIANAVRFAAMTDAVVIPAFCTRTGGARFNVTFMPPVELASTTDRDTDLRMNIARLNAVIEPIIRENLDQWLWLFDLRPDD